MIYVARDDVDAAYERARDAGATIVREPTETEYGSREFAVRDPEGYGWSFGTYRPTYDGAPDPAVPAVYAGMRYERAHEAIAWLVEAFGFEKQEVYDGEGGTVAHAQLRFGDDVLMLGSARNDEAGTATPAQTGGLYTHAYCLYVADPDAHYARAVKAGAKILAPPTTKDYGGRDYLALDPEGYAWSFGTWRPVAEASETVGTKAG